MKTLYVIIIVLMLFSSKIQAQQTNKSNAFDKANNAVNKANNAVNRTSSAIAVFQPYLLKARQLFYDTKQLTSDVKNSAKNTFTKKKGNYNNTTSNGNGSNIDTTNNSNAYSNGNTNNNVNYSSINQGTPSYSSNNNSPQNYLSGQTLPINNPSIINNDGTGNLGNQNNGLYGNCLDVMTGNVMGMGDAAQTPTSVDLLFFAPTDGQNTYYLMTPGFAKNNSTAGYMTEHTSEQVMQWTDVNESEIALTKLTIGQFNQIQNNSQIQSAVRNAQNYAAYYSSPGQKLDGQVFAVKMQMENREVYALVAVIKHIGTSGSNGYLKINIKSTGIDANHDGQVDTNAYIR